MKKVYKSYKIEADCPNCANDMEEVARKTEGVEGAVVVFMTQRMKVAFKDGANEVEVMKRIREKCKDIDDDCEIFLDE